MTASSPTRPRAVILFIGSGLGLAQVQAGRLLKGAEVTSTPGARLQIDDLPVLAVLDNHAVEGGVTDAAATATALATGRRGEARTLSTDANGTSLPTLLEQARARGRATGLVTTASLSNPAVAAFAAHARNGGDSAGVAAQYVDHAVVDVLLGGGRAFFLPRGVEGGQRTDGRDLREALRTKGWVSVSGREALMSDAGSPRVLGLFDETAMAHELDRLPEQPSLADMTSGALRSLARSPKGFLLVVEAGTLDAACHANDLAAAVRDILALDAAVAVARDFQRTHPNTLVLVVGDHETGGLSLPVRFDPRALLPQKASIEAVLGSFPTRELDPSSEAFLQALRDRLAIDPDVPLREKLKRAQAQPKEMLYLLATARTARTGAVFATHGHTALPALLWAAGPGQGEFSGTYDITGVHARLMRLLDEGANLNLRRGEARRPKPER